MRGMRDVLEVWALSGLLLNPRGEGMGDAVGNKAGSLHLSLDPSMQ